MAADRLELLGDVLEFGRLRVGRLNPKFATPSIRGQIEDFLNGLDPEGKRQEGLNEAYCKGLDKLLEEVEDLTNGSAGLITKDELERMIKKLQSRGVGS